MTFEQWTESAVERDVTDIEESEFHELTGDVYNVDSFSYGDFEAAIIVHADGGWIEKATFQREGISAYYVNVSNCPAAFSTLIEAQRYLWESHSRHNY